MISLADRLDQYVTERRLYGGNWASQAKQVRPFVTFADSEGAQWITTGLFLRWKEQFGCAGPGNMGRPAVGGPRLRHLVARDRSANASAPQGIDTSAGVSDEALHLFRWGRSAGS